MNYINIMYYQWLKGVLLWKVPKLTPVIIFMFCSAINDNLIYIDYLSTQCKKQLNNINANEKVVKINKEVKDILKDLFK